MDRWGLRPDDPDDEDPIASLTAKDVSITHDNGHAPEPPGAGGYFGRS
jgi:hypothetical protein